jgi:hypothetical protein
MDLRLPDISGIDAMIAIRNEANNRVGAAFESHSQMFTAATVYSSFSWAILDSSTAVKPSIS